MPNREEVEWRIASRSTKDTEEKVFVILYVDETDHWDEDIYTLFSRDKDEQRARALERGYKKENEVKDEEE